MPAEITLPAFLEEKLRNAPYRHVVQKALENFSDWFRASRLPFFPDYTDHGIQHMEQVLETAVKLIPDTARLHFSGADAAALVLAVLFHDSALHLTEAGFHQLIKGTDAAYAPMKPFDTTDWAQTWADFMFLARRWDDAKLVQVFGGDNGVPTGTVQDPFAHWHNLTRTDYLLIGEFIRQQHPRLAHEMARHGVPGPNGQLLKLDESLPHEWRDLVGLIARSHGLPLRTCLDYLKNAPDFGEEARREYQGVHAVYLMALLRVADYFQIDSNRTSSRIFEYKKIYSGISEIEHKAHQAVRNITKGDDKEALFIQAKPDEVAVFLRLKEWLAGIQQELDASWAVLGEVYGRYEEEGWDTLGLTFRRVRSNLDDVAEFAKTVPYVPDRIRFDVARAELLKLLIGPLYGDDPSYGVRELMQNSIDAVREYDQFVLDNPEYADIPRREQEADVVVELGPFDEAKGYAVMTISDRGIGMTEATIRDYFLRAGASYRQSANWKTAFEIDDATGGKSKVLRSGRFGIGALAAFLIGQDMEVETRYIGSKEGYVFNTTLDLDSINVNRAQLPVGTSIRIMISHDNYIGLLTKHQKKFSPSRFNWYLLDKPTVMRRWYGPGDSIVNITNQEGMNFTNNDQNWRRIETPFPYEIYWTLQGAPNLTCNGLFVSNSDALRNVPNEILKSDNAPVQFPLVSIVDPDGKFPLNLERNNIRSDSYEFGLALVRDLLQEMLSWLLFNGPVCAESVSIQHTIMPWLSTYANHNTLVASKSGYAVRLVSLLDGISVRHTINHHHSGFVLDVQTEDSLIFGHYLPWASGSYGTHLSEISVVEGLGTDKKVKSLTRKVFYSEKYSNKSAPRGKLKRESNYRDEVVYELEQQKKGWLVAAEHGCPTREFNVTKWPKPVFHRSSGEGSRTYFIEHFFPEESYFKAISKPWLLDELWQEHFGKSWIPFALEDRIAKFPQAAQFLKERYPQVVPDEAWALLGGKPAKGN
ncbi:ATP-binding protein [Hymenobacter sp. 5317J-9]|uniref:HD domain-containing protein n=1 Tax=Hymenobacter sp. 5317J-9 TaxID=2932250 RepID=UPI001FD69C1B|nr:ATP-binding protein [Hymenobacter sp. 5317J-9]UOQ97255.1 ATP-binding protein [Hymenobacter sp. 5317J-9]